MRACNRACNEGMQLGDWATAQARAAPNHFRYTAAAITLRDTIHRYRCDAGPMAWIMRDAPPPCWPYASLELGRYLGGGWPAC